MYLETDPRSPFSTLLLSQNKQTDKKGLGIFFWTSLLHGNNMISPLPLNISWKWLKYTKVKTLEIHNLHIYLKMCMTTPKTISPFLTMFFYGPWTYIVELSDNRGGRKGGWVTSDGAHDNVPNTDNAVKQESYWLWWNINVFFCSPNLLSWLDSSSEN